jgi:SAM-dependent methyltransferase
MTSVTLSVHDADFYNEIRAGSESSARVIARLLREVLDCRSVVDFGCGTGLWLRAFQALGVADLAGVDGDHIAVESLAVDPTLFFAHDLTSPVDLGRRFDLAICLEVAEHLPDASGGVLVDSITRHSDRVLFSGGVPLQLGTGHVSGRWQSAWVEEFGARGYLPVDIVRPRVWHDPNVEYWYAQNALLFVTPAALEASAVLRREANASTPIFDVVHPAHYLELKEEVRRLRSPGIVGLLRQARQTLLRTLGRRARRDGAESGEKRVLP